VVLEDEEEVRGGEEQRDELTTISQTDGEKRISS